MTMRVPVETIHISRILEGSKTIQSCSSFCSLSAGDILVGKKVSKQGSFSLAVPGCAIVISHEPSTKNCNVSWFTGPKSGKTELLSLHDLQRDFDLLPSGE